MMNIRLPNINAATEKEQLVQVKSYLHQLAQELNWALSSGSGVTKEELENVRNEVAMLSDQVEQLGIRLQEHIKGG